ncbi:hypothetical protein XE88_c21302 [Vibrio parahaemolyticus]|nr:hypothetical protein XE88_c21302 [Vibrio parahaemolyticus]
MTTFQKTYKSEHYEYSSDLEKTSLSNNRGFGIRLRGLADVKTLTE